MPSFGMREYDAWGGRLATSDTIRRYFGSWGNALQAAELRAVRGHKLDPRAMGAALKECWEHNASVPSVRRVRPVIDVSVIEERHTG
jgi:hypothetical protein